MNRPSTTREACEPDAQPEQKQRPQYRVVRRVSKATGATVPWIRESHLGRNDPCPCECGRKAKRCERGLALIEAARWE